MTTIDEKMAYRYNANLADAIETKWQQRWASEGTFCQPNPGEDGFDAGKPKFYALDMFPYPSGAGLHVGHPEGYTATDIISRYKRMAGFNVLHPMGWDAFGLPAEQYAIQTGIHPATTTRTSIDNFRRQLQRFGFSYDWDREFGTIDPDYYKWTQWIFLELYNAWFDEEQQKARPIDELVAGLESGSLRINTFGELTRVGRSERDLGAIAGGSVDMEWSSLSPEERREVIDGHRLAYIGEQTVNWCPKLGTALANEEVIDGRSERGAFPVLRKPLRQWMFRITAYCDRLLRGLDDVEWPTSTKTMQTEWIGRSEGALIRFAIDDDAYASLESEELSPTIEVFTTRPDTLFGATYMVVAPEHQIVDAALAAADGGEKALREYVEQARNRSDVERMESKEKTGVPLGISVTNPATGRSIPVWVSDYVLASYGSGAVMAVPAHDQRDFDFAEAHGLPIEEVVYPSPLYPMWWAGMNASDELLHVNESEEAWRESLADFLGYVAVNSMPESEYVDALKLLSTRRVSPQDDQESLEVGTLEGADLEDTLSYEGLVGEKRGIVRMSWFELLDSMGFTDLESFRTRIGHPIRSKRLGFAYTAAGRNINSSNAEVSLNGLTTEEAKEEAIAWLERSGHGKRRINYKLRDWLFSRQRYWGEPFPIVFDEKGDHYPVSAEALPVRLPGLDDYAPEESEDPKPLLAKASGWVSTTAGAAGVDGSVLSPDTPVTRETNTMPGWAGSCWYYLRYIDPKNEDRLVGQAAEAYWMGEGDGSGVDLYIGGAEHAVLHLLYARFWHMVLFDLGHVSTPEPFSKLFHQGLILSQAYQRKDKSLVAIDEVDETEAGGFVQRGTGDHVEQVIAKMSKTLKNVVNPDDIITEYGADCFRLYEMYMGPLEAAKPWNTRDMIGLQRFLQRAWRLAVDEETGELVTIDTADEAVEKQLHRAIAKVGEDIEELRFNTAIAAMIELVNAASKSGGMTTDQLSRFTRILCPFAPHIAEEIWEKIEEEISCSLADWPAYDEAMLVDDEVEIAVQLMGKVKERLMVPASADKEQLEKIVMSHEAVQRMLEGKTVRKLVAVPGRMVNIVAN